MPTKTVSTHRHPRHGDGFIVSWFENDQVMFQSNYGKHFLLESALTVIAPYTPPVTAIEPPELPKPAEAVRNRLEALAQEPSAEVAGDRLNLNKVSAAREISTAFPQLGRVGAKKLHEKRPVDGWVSVPSIREVVGELFPTEEAWVAFASIVEV